MNHKKKQQEIIERMWKYLGSDVGKEYKQKAIEHLNEVSKGCGNDAGVMIFKKIYKCGEGKVYYCKDCKEVIEKYKEIL